MRQPYVTSAFGFIAPALGLILVFFVLPVIGALVLSFSDFDIYALGDPGKLRWIGLSNYRQLLNDSRFWVAMKNTGYFALVGGPLSMVVSLSAALLVNHRHLPLRGLWRTALFLPVVTTLVAVAVVWRYLYHPRYGALNAALSQFGIDPIDWLGDPDWAMPAIILMTVWKNFGLNMIVFIAGLQSIPQRLYESAALDGAGQGQQFWCITLPMLAPTLAFVGLMTMIGYLQVFAEPYVMTQGGPSDRTLSMALLMYQEGFRWWNLGYSAAIAFTLFVLVLAATSLLLWLRGQAPSVRS